MKRQEKTSECILEDIGIRVQKISGDELKVDRERQIGGFK